MDCIPRALSGFQVCSDRDWGWGIPLKAHSSKCASGWIHPTEAGLGWATLCNAASSQCPPCLEKGVDERRIPLWSSEPSPL